MRTKAAITVLVMVAMVAAGSLASAGDWHKLGSKAIAFKDKPVEISVKAKDASVNELKLKVNGAWVRFTSMTVNFSDGTSQTFDEQIDVEPGMTSEALALEAGPKQIATIDVTCESANAARGGRATIAVLGS